MRLAVFDICPTGDPIDQRIDSELVEIDLELVRLACGRQSNLETACLYLPDQLRDAIERPRKAGILCGKAHLAASLILCASFPDSAATAFILSEDSPK
jgi:hypothetical protein